MANNKEIIKTIINMGSVDIIQGAVCFWVFYENVNNEDWFGINTYYQENHKECYLGETDIFGNATVFVYRP